MADVNERVMAMIEKEIQADPDISNQVLRDKAVRLDESIGSLSARQFNATYPLQVKRRMRPARRGRKGARATGGAARRGRPAKAGSKRGSKRAGASSANGRKRGRDAAVAGGANIREGGRGAKSRGRAVRADSPRGRVRATLLDFARDLANADGARLVDVIAGVDDYVDRVMKATGTR